MEPAVSRNPRPPLFAAILLAVGGLLFLAAGTVDRAIASSEKQAYSGNYAESLEAIDTAEQYLQYGSWIPPIRRRLNDVRARRAAAHYWRREYDRVVSDDANPIAAIPAENVDLQLITANALYRKSQPVAKDRTNTLRVLDAVINTYVAVLRNGGNEEAAYNYEYLVRVREDVDKGRRTADLTEKAEDGPAGEQGRLPPEPDQRDLKILIPLSPGEMDKAIDPGKGTPIQRKG